MIKIIQKRKIAYWVSGVLIALSLVVLSMWGLNLGIDFKGGTIMEIEFSEESVPSRDELSSKLSETGISPIVQATNDRSYFIRYGESNEDVNQQVLGKLKEIDENVVQKRVDFVGGVVSDQIKKSAFLAIALAIFGIAVYIAWAFRKVSYPIPSWQYGIGAIIALTHDIIITLGVFAVLGRYLGVEVGVPFVAALLTILGYSVNDTIVVYDRTRENLLKSSRKDDFEEVVNKSLNETMARSINTSLTVIVVLVAIAIMGSATIQYFAIALLIGVFFGTYSSIFVATALLVTRFKYVESK